MFSKKKNFNDGTCLWKKSYTLSNFLWKGGVKNELRVNFSSSSNNAHSFIVVSILFPFVFVFSHTTFISYDEMAFYSKNGLRKFHRYRGREEEMEKKTNDDAYKCELRAKNGEIC